MEEDRITGEPDQQADAEITGIVTGGESGSTGENRSEGGEAGRTPGRPRGSRRKDKGSGGQVDAARTAGDQGENLNQESEASGSPLAIEIPKTRTRRSKAVSEAGEVWTKEFIAGAIGTLVAMNIALKPVELRELWALSADEIKAIVEPADKWIKSMNPEVLAKVSKYAYPLLTMMAVGAAVVPRTMIESAYLNDKKRASKLRQEGVPETGITPESSSPFKSSVKEDAYKNMEAL